MSNEKGPALNTSSAGSVSYMPTCTLCCVHAHCRFQTHKMDVVNRLIFPVYTTAQLLPLRRARAHCMNSLHKQGRESAYMATQV